jgi:hypothetical protein
MKFQFKIQPFQTANNIYSKEQIGEVLDVAEYWEQIEERAGLK